RGKLVTGVQTCALPILFGQSDFSLPGVPDRAEPAGVAQSRHGEAWTPGVVAEPAEVLANDEVNKEYRHLVVRCGDVSASAAPGRSEERRVGKEWSAGEE